jgi:hypothetical protein
MTTTMNGKKYLLWLVECIERVGMYIWHVYLHVYLV